MNEHMETFEIEVERINRNFVIDTADAMGLNFVFTSGPRPWLSVHGPADKVRRFKEQLQRVGIE